MDSKYSEDKDEVPSFPGISIILRVTLETESKVWEELYWDEDEVEEDEGKRYTVLYSIFEEIVIMYEDLNSPFKNLLIMLVFPTLS